MATAELPAVMRFLGLSWFNRLWIVQELVFNLQAGLVHGSSTVAWPRIANAVQFLRAHERVELDHCHGDRLLTRC